jgi:hypothetical protein
MQQHLFQEGVGRHPSKSVQPFVLYTDGGCSGNQFRDISIRKMIAVVTNESGIVLVEKHQEGGSNNIAELLAVKEAMLWATAHDYGNVEIRTDSRNNFAWVFGRKVRKAINDRAAVMALKAQIAGLKRMIAGSLVWLPANRISRALYRGKVPAITSLCGILYDEIANATNAATPASN